MKGKRRFDPLDDALEVAPSAAFLAELVIKETRERLIELQTKK